MSNEINSGNETKNEMPPVSVFDVKPKRKSFPFDSIFTFVVRSSGLIIFLLTALVFVFIAVESFKVFGYSVTP
jgi:hypothetical protein